VVLFQRLVTSVVSRICTYMYSIFSLSCPAQQKIKNSSNIRGRPSSRPLRPK